MARSKKILIFPQDHIYIDLGCVYKKNFYWISKAIINQAYKEILIEFKEIDPSTSIKRNFKNAKTIDIKLNSVKIDTILEKY